MAKAQQGIVQRYEQYAEAARRQFRRDLSLLPSSCAKVALESHDDRLGRARNTFSIGEMTPWMLADILAVEPRDIAPVARGWLHLLLGILILDDVLDARFASDQERHCRTIVADLLTQRGVRLLSGAVLPDREQDFDQGIARAAEAAIFEIERHRGLVSPYDPLHLEQVGRKLAMIQTCAAAVLSVSRLEVKWKDIEVLIDGIARAVQILDDVTDLREDWEAKSLTLPLTEAVRRGYLILEDAGDGPVGFLSGRELLARVVYSGALNEATAVALEALSIVESELRRLGRTNSDIYHYFSRLRRGVHAVDMLARDLRGDYDWNALAHLERRLRTFAQGS